MKGDNLGEFEELVLLTVCSLNGQAYGLAIRKMIAEEAERTVSVGAIYAALERLERKGYVESWMGEPTQARGGRRKRMYEATAEGVELLVRIRRVRARFWERFDELGLAGGGS